MVQYCLAHLIRDIKFLTTLPGRDAKAYGERLRQLVRELFAIIHEREQFVHELALAFANGETALIE